MSQTYAPQATACYSREQLLQVLHFLCQWRGMTSQTYARHVQPAQPIRPQDTYTPSPRPMQATCEAGPSNNTPYYGPGPQPPPAQDMQPPSQVSHIIVNTLPTITGRNNRILIPQHDDDSTPPSSSSSSSTPLSGATPSSSMAETTRTLAVFLATVQRLNAGTAERNAQILARFFPDRPAPVPVLAPVMNVNIVVNTGVRVEGDGNVVLIGGGGAAVKRKRETEDVKRFVRRRV